MQLFQWIAAHWQTVCGWATGLYLLYRVCLVFTGLIKFLAAASIRVQTWESTLLQVDGSVKLALGNHLPHIQAELEKSNTALANINETLREMREDQRLMLTEKFISSSREQY